MSARREPDRQAPDEMPAEGTPAPAFTLPDDTGAPVALRALRGRPVVLYFYPKDATAG